MNKYFLSAAIAAAATLTACNSDNTEYDATGVFEATEVVVSAKSQGQIMTLTVEEGDDVKAGDTLGTIDITQLSLQREQLVASKASNDSRVLNITSQIASIKQQIANAEREKKRYEELVKAEAASQKQVDDIVYQINVLQKQLQATQEQIESSNTATDRQSTSITAQVSGVDAKISDAFIIAPLSGTVLTKYVEQGEYATPGRAIVKVADISTLTLRAYVDAALVTTLKIGQQVTVYADIDESDRKALQGKVTWISSEAEFTPKTIQTRDERSNLVYAVKIDVKNDGTIKRGMYADVKF